MDVGIESIAWNTSGFFELARTGIEFRFELAAAVGKDMGRYSFSYQITSSSSSLKRDTCLLRLPLLPLDSGKIVFSGSGILNESITDPLQIVLQ